MVTQAEQLASELNSAQSRGQLVRFGGSVMGFLYFLLLGIGMSQVVLRLSIFEYVVY